MADRRRTATDCGIAGALVSLGAILLATIVAPPETFTWQGHALSDMGRYGAPTFPIFNGGLVLSGLLGLPFIWLVWITSRNALERLGVALLALAVVGMIGVGIFFLDHTEVYFESSMHGLAALMVFGIAPFASWVYGTGAALAGDSRLAIASFWFGNVHPLAWLGWIFSVGGAATSSTWFAVPEFVVSVAFSGWILSLAFTIRQRDDGELDVPNR